MEWIHLQSIISYLEHHPHSAVLLAFLSALIESIAFVGAIVPGSVILAGVGILIGTGVAPASPTIFAAILGAIIGDVGSFYVGKLFNQSLLQKWPFYQYPQIIERGEDFFKLHGGKSIFIGRFVGPVRSIIPIVAGILGMRPLYFIVMDSLSALCWAPAYMFPGIVLGAASQELSPDIATRFIMYALLSLLLIYFTSWVLTFIIRWKINQINSLLDNLWQAIRRHKRFMMITEYFADPTHPEGHGQLGRIIGATLCFTLFIILAIHVHLHAGLTRWNEPFYQLLQDFRTHTLDAFACAITLLAEKNLLFIFAILITVYLWIQKNYRAAIHFIACFAATAGSAFILKHIINNLRPAAILAVRSSPSFPSGHSVLTFSLFAALMTLLNPSISLERRRNLYYPVVIYMILVAFSRLYLGAHWLTDIVGAALLAGGFVLLMSLSYHRKAFPAINANKLMVFAFICFAGLGCIQIPLHLSSTLQEYNSQSTTKFFSVSQWWKHSKEHLYNLLKN